MVESVPSCEALEKTISSSTQVYVTAAVNRKSFKEEIWKFIIVKKPPSGLVKLNFDVGLDQNSKTVRVVLIWNTNRDVIGAWVERNIAEEAFTVEAEAALLCFRGFSREMFSQSCNWRWCLKCYPSSKL